MGEVPCKFYLDDPEPLGELHPHHHPHPSKEILKAYEEYQNLFKDLPARDYSPLIKEYLEKIREFN